MSGKPFLLWKFPRLPVLALPRRSSPDVPLKQKAESGNRKRESPQHRLPRRPGEPSPGFQTAYSLSRQNKSYHFSPHKKGFLFPRLPSPGESAAECHPAPCWSPNPAESRDSSGCLRRICIIPFPPFPLKACARRTHTKEGSWIYFCSRILLVF